MKQRWMVGIAVGVVSVFAQSAGAGSYGGGPTPAFVPAVAHPATARVDHRFRRVDDGDFYFGMGPAWGWGPWWAPPPLYYPPPPVIVTPPPQITYIAPERPRPYYWYYCESSKTYYPYVKKCPGGWMKVVPHPPRGAR
ncbi:MAG TPA: hypothetical protein ENI71_05030 [Chromatiales bacterium]|nr:hypothetical protein [Chromatiales bacterium]